jgi:hypothetical protein
MHSSDAAKLLLAEISRTLSPLRGRDVVESDGELIVYLLKI